MGTKTLGKFGEDKAFEYLKSKGYKILERNWKNKWGEIDIVARKKGKIIFVEVKTIRPKWGFVPEDELNQKKKRQLLKMAQIYLSAHNLPLNTPQQIDILAIEIAPFSELPNIRHLENAIEDIF